MSQTTTYHPRAIGNVHSLALAMLPQSASLRILDAAAGTGDVSERLQRAGHNVVLADIDFSVSMERAFQCVRADFNGKLPFDDNFFDGVLSIETIEHLENPWAFVRELSRITRTGGFIILTTPNIQSVYSRALMMLAGRLLWFQERDVKPLGHITPIHKHLLGEMIRRANLTLVERRFSKGRIPLLNIFLPGGNSAFGECMLTKCIKSSKRRL